MTCNSQSSKVGVKKHFLCENIVNILNFVVFVVSDELLNFATEIEIAIYNI